MRRVLALVVTALLILPVEAVAGSSGSIASDVDTPPSAPGPAKTDEGGVGPDESALADDLAAVAEANGISYEQAARSHDVATGVGRIAETIARDRPEIYVGAALGERPGDKPTLYVKGPADRFVTDLVRKSGIEVVIADGQPFSFDELEARKLRVHRALESLGFDNVATSVNITGGGVIPAGVSAPAGLSASAATADAILTSLPADLRDSVQLTVHEEPIAVDFQAFGGMWILDNGANACTSGFSVRNLATGTLGVSTAGHCIGMDQINHPGHGIHNLTFQARHRGQWGDVEWYSTAEPEPDDFYADTGNVIRDVAAVEPRANILVNESVCQYGRSSDDRDCSLEVQDVSQACTNNGVFNDRLVMMNGVTGQPGDSGGPWSFGLTAFGIEKGVCFPDFPNREVWTVADLFDEAINVRVTCGC